MKFSVKDFMSKDIKSILPDMNAKEALRALLESGISGFPVIDAGGKLLGAFTEKEVLKAIVPGYVKAVGNFIYSEESRTELKKLANLDKYLVKDLMRKEISTVDEETSLTEASKVMLTKGERRIVVMREGKPVGVITRADVVLALAKQAEIIL